MAFWKKTGYVAGVASGILPVVWMGRLTWRAGRAMIPPLHTGDSPENPAVDSAAEAAARFARTVAAQQLTAADLQRAHRRAQWRMHLSALCAAALLVYGTLHPAAWTFLPLCALSWIYGHYQSDCLVRRELPLFRSWVLAPFRRGRQENHSGE
ncbi:hypothetical protein HER14_01920 [Acidithiobacillus thiooxidans]|uniref:hypothetical protein n=1 Tax=Acidithiobacillus thiooxidans TaxID=930 RepID=UPI001C07BF1A|nr:hypothetical protein [Acidithiobacillus thiooxidans]MBU2749760.1 hypothetical protein [Acidithiobacillus thiooxidans]